MADHPLSAGERLALKEKGMARTCDQVASGLVRGSFTQKQRHHSNIESVLKKEKKRRKREKK